MLSVYTSRISYVGPDKLDITVKSRNAFSPVWDMVTQYKQGGITEEQYASQYESLMRISWIANTDEWRKLLARDKVVLCCYCKVGAFCHRLLLAKILVKCGAVYEGEI